MNVLSFTGHLGGDAETRFSKSGTAITTFSVPVEQGWGENKVTTWVRCTLFGKKGTGEAHGLTPYLTKGKFIAVTGEMLLDQWEHEGKSHAQVKCVVKDVSLGPSAQQEAPAAASQPQQQESFEDDIPF